MRLVLEFDEEKVSVRMDMSHAEFLRTADELVRLLLDGRGVAGVVVGRGSRKARVELGEENQGGADGEGA